MKLLHTSDWHVGKQLRGRDRSSEFVAVLDEIVGIARAEAVDLVIVAGDLFETAAPPADAERIVYRALLDLAGTGARVVVVSGNHDNERRLQALEPLLDLGRVMTRSHLRAASDGGVFGFDTAAGEPVNVALMPWLNRQHIVQADRLMNGDVAENNALYRDRIASIAKSLTASFRPDAVNLVAAHLMVSNATLGGGERAAHTIFDYCVNALDVFPADAHYVALGHLHRAQRVYGACMAWYCGSPLQLDFGETTDRKCVLIVEATPGVPPTVREVALQSGRRLRRIEGTLEHLESLAGFTGEDYLRVVVQQARPGVGDAVRELFGDYAVDVEIARSAPASKTADRPARAGRTPHELFADYLAEHNATNEQVLALFDQLHEESYAS